MASAKKTAAKKAATPPKPAATPAPAASSGTATASAATASGPTDTASAGPVTASKPSAEAAADPAHFEASDHRLGLLRFVRALPEVPKGAKASPVKGGIEAFKGETDRRTMRVVKTADGFAQQEV